MQKTYSTGIVGVLDVQDKFQLMVIKRLVSEYSNVIFYSDFESEFKESKKTGIKKASSDIISFYTANSYSKRNSQIIPRKENISSMAVDKYIFVEFITTKRQIIFKGKTYESRALNFELWDRLIQEFQNRTLVQINKTQINKLKKVYGDGIKMLDDIIDDQNFINNFSTISDYYLFMNFKGQDYQTLSNIIFYIIKELHDPFKLKQAFDSSEILGLILNSFQSDIGVLFSVLLKMINIKNSGRSRNYRDHSSSITQSIFPIPSANTLDFELYKTLTPSPVYDKLSKAITSLANFSRDNNEVSHSSRSFLIEDYFADRHTLLRRSKNLNIYKDEIRRQENILLHSYLSKWDILVRYIDSLDAP
jgi:hypothetical protein